MRRRRTQDGRRNVNGGVNHEVDGTALHHLGLTHLVTAGEHGIRIHFHIDFAVGIL